MVKSRNILFGHMIGSHLIARGSANKQMKKERATPNGLPLGVILQKIILPVGALLRLDCGKHQRYSVELLSC